MKEITEKRLTEILSKVFKDIDNGKPITLITGEKDKYDIDTEMIIKTYEHDIKSLSESYRVLREEQYYLYKKYDRLNSLWVIKGYNYIVDYLNKKK